MRKAQGGLEYLIIISAILAVSAVVVMTITGVFTGGTPDVSYPACKQAAVDCMASRMLAPDDPCLGCVDACKDPVSGEEIFFGATECCQKTMTDFIYPGSAGCQEPPRCGDGNIDLDEECDDGNTVDGDGCSSMCALQSMELFYDEFSTLNSWQGDITVSQWHINSTYGNTGSNSAMKGWTNYTAGGGYAQITHAQSTAGFEDITVSFWSSRIFRAPGHLSISVSADGGTTWAFSSGQMMTNETVWTYHAYSLPSEFENNPNVVLRISASLFYSASSVSSYVAVDGFNMSGTPLS